MAQLVEHNLAKVGAAGSSPVSRFFYFDIDRVFYKWGNKKYWVSVDSGLETWMKSGKKWKWIGFAK